MIDKYICADCYEIENDCKIEDAYNFIWIDIIACEICKSQPVIWFKKEV